MVAADGTRASTPTLRRQDPSETAPVELETRLVSSVELNKRLHRHRTSFTAPVTEPTIVLSEKPSTVTLRGSDTDSHKGIAYLAKGDDVESAPSFPDSLPMSEEKEDSMTCAISAEQNVAQSRKMKIHFATLFFAEFMNGWNDGIIGPLLPVIQAYYGINFATVSLIFIFNTVGYLSGAFANVYLTDRFGFGKILVFGSMCQLAGYIILAPVGPFPLMCLAFVLIGLGLSLQNAHCNGYVGSSRENASTKMNLLHATYGFGALVSPFVATQLAQPKHLAINYYILVGLYVFNTLLLLVVFRGRRQTEIKAEEGELEQRSDPKVVQTNKYKEIFRIREVHFLAIWALIYIGTEVTIGGWTVTYIQRERNGNSSAGYISSGFFGGLMMGRILLLWLNRKIGECRVFFLYAIIAILLEVTVWAVPSLVENAVAVAFVGLVLGPMYPIMMNHASSILPHWLFTGCVGYIASIGQTGSAVLPFLTGLLASKFGIVSLQPFIVSMMSALIVIWAVIPTRARYPGSPSSSTTLA
ncbi:MFS general substrate transporter [Daedaleopsis nitida]|nr:MFS general substrate transporter [Daedaleopsis nitida]